MPSRFIFCNDCAARFLDENGMPTAVFLAMFGPQGIGDEDALLVCSYVEDAHPLLPEHPYTSRPCDGCNRDVFISGSSFWYLKDRESPPKHQH